MSRPSWHQVWQARGASLSVPAGGAETLHRLMEMDGYYSPTSTASLADHEVQFRYVVESLGIGPDDSVYEVGCGAGALLYWLRSRCATVGGSDFAESLVDHAQSVLPDMADIRRCEARAIEPVPTYDIVVSNGVFIYFPDVDYAREVVDRMVAKAVRAVGILDVNDAERRDEFEAVRRAHQGDQHHRYVGLDQLYLPRQFFWDLARDHGLRCRIDDSTTPNSANARFRYHVCMFKR